MQVLKLSECLSEVQQRVEGVEAQGYQNSGRRARRKLWGFPKLGTSFGVL